MFYLSCLFIRSPVLRVGVSPKRLGEVSGHPSSSLLNSLRGLKFSSSSSFFFYLTLPPPLSFSSLPLFICLSLLPSPPFLWSLFGFVLRFPPIFPGSQRGEGGGRQDREGPGSRSPRLPLVLGTRDSPPSSTPTRGESPTKGGRGRDLD